MTSLGLIFRVINIVLMLGIPALLALNLTRRGKGGFRPIWIGAVGFVLSQVGHIPFNQFALMPFLAKQGISPGVEGLVPSLILGMAVGLSAGVFEETARFLALKYWLRDQAQELLPLKYGVGHGGVEAVLVGGLALAAFVQVMVFGGEGALAQFEADQAALIRSQLELYWSVPWQQAILGAWERVSAISFHIGASLLVYKSIREKRIRWYVGALIGHTVFNAFAVVFAPSMNLVWLEAVLFVFGAGWLAWAWLIRARDPEGLELDQPPLPEMRFGDPQVTAEQIEESRYDE